MLPKTRADQIFPGACGDYTAHLGEHQAAAFTILWNLHDSPDPISDMDDAGWHIVQGLRSNDGIKIAPREVTGVLQGRSTVVEDGYPQQYNAIDVEYAGLFVMIAEWQHELLDDAIGSLIDTVAE